MNNYKVYEHAGDEGIVYNENEVKELIDSWVKDGGDVLSNGSGSTMFLTKHGTRYYKIIWLGLTIAI